MSSAVSNLQTGSRPRLCEDRPLRIARNCNSPVCDVRQAITLRHKQTHIHSVYDRLAHTSTHRLRHATNTRKHSYTVTSTWSKSLDHTACTHKYTDPNTSRRSYMTDTHGVKCTHMSTQTQLHGIHTQALTYKHSAKGLLLAHHGDHGGGLLCRTPGAPVARVHPVIQSCRVHRGHRAQHMRCSSNTKYCLGASHARRVRQSAGQLCHGWPIRGGT